MVKRTLLLAFHCVSHFEKPKEKRKSEMKHKTASTASVSHSKKFISTNEMFWVDKVKRFGNSAHRFQFPTQISLSSCFPSPFNLFSLLRIRPPSSRSIDGRFAIVRLCAGRKSEVFVLFIFCLFRATHSGREPSLFRALCSLSNLKSRDRRCFP